MVQSTSTLPAAELDDDAALHAWLQALDAHYAPEDQQRIRAACTLLIDERVEGIGLRQRLSIADILFHLRMDADTLCAALLNGCLGWSGLSEATLAERFGLGLARMVADLGRIGQLTGVERRIAAKDQPEHEENLRRLLLGIAEDVRVVLVVLAERLHHMRHARELERSHQLALAEDTERVYAPLANRLGIWQLKWELEDLALRTLHPQDYQAVAAALSERRAERQAYIAGVIERLRAEFERAGLVARISGRPKHIYSIWRKMQRKGLSIEQIFDLRALRVIVEDLPSCYAALGVVHGLWKHIPQEFDDYIATPKGNLYRSLHTAVIGPEDKPVEVQIRTEEMHQHAELGVAAHWAYKEAAGHDADFQRRVVWMRNWLELQSDCERSSELLERFKAECEPSHVYVLTPQAKVVELPKGATPIDFAYAIHSEIGHHCRGARVDGRIVPLNHVLASGEKVEILTQKNAAPSRDWLSAHHHYLITSKARNRVRQWFKSREPDRVEPPPAPAPAPARRRRARRPQMPQGPGARGVVVQGVDDLLTQIANCCKPVPRDPIIGFITRGRGVRIHRRTCRNIANLPATERERLVEAHWAEAPQTGSFAVDLHLLATSRPGLLRDVSALLAEAETDVISLRTQRDARTDLTTMRFTLRVSSLDELEALLNRLRHLPDTLEVRRV